MATEKEKELYSERFKKLEELRKNGVDPYPISSHRTHPISQVLESFSELEANGAEVVLTGRLRSIRGHGAMVFADMTDASGKIQLLFKEDKLGEEKHKFFAEYFDIGDFVEVSGKLMQTKRGEQSVLVSDFKILSKSLRALPDKWHGLTDAEIRLRKRYLDMLADPEIRDLFMRKNLFWQTIRNYLMKNDFVEVETAVLERIPGGAEAEPFVTHHNALDRDFYLRISLELPLKRLIIGGFEKVFEIGRIFRNEGISSEHLQDYTQMEFYWAYADYRDLMKFVKEMYQGVVTALFGQTKVTHDGHEIDWGGEWKNYDYYELFKENTGIDLSSVDESVLRKKADELGIVYEKFAAKGRLIDLIYKKTVRPKLIEPGFLIDPPVEIEPLAKRSMKDPNRVERMQVMAWGTELGKGFSELNDPLDQRQRFEAQMHLRESGDKEAQMMDEDYVEALEYGMPPTAGFGLSERFFAVLMDRPIRETVIFPPMKEK